jgi:hypothetical protein
LECDSQDWERDSQAWESVPQKLETESQNLGNDSQKRDSDSQEWENEPQNGEKDSQKRESDSQEWENEPQNGENDSQKRDSDSQEWENEPEIGGNDSQKRESESQEWENPPPSINKSQLTTQDLKRAAEILEAPQLEKPGDRGSRAAEAPAAERPGKVKPAQGRRKAWLYAGGNSSPRLPESAATMRYHQVTGTWPNRAQRQLLAAQVSDLERWGATLEHWLFHGWNPLNVAGQLELYRRGGPTACRYCQRGESALDQTLANLSQLRKELADGNDG